MDATSSWLPPRSTAIGWLNEEDTMSSKHLWWGPFTSTFYGHCCSVKQKEKGEGRRSSAIYLPRRERYIVVLHPSEDRGMSRKLAPPFCFFKKTKVVLNCARFVLNCAANDFGKKSKLGLKF